jgi:hypothetical protein
MLNRQWFMSNKNTSPMPSARNDIAQQFAIKPLERSALTKIETPEQGTYRFSLFQYWSEEFKGNPQGHNAYIALNFANALQACKSKFEALLAYHQQFVNEKANGDVHSRAIERLNRTMTGSAIGYAQSFKRG